MKTILILLVAILLAGSIIPGFRSRPEVSSNILVQPLNVHLNQEQLQYSAEILSRRIRQFSGEKPVIHISTENQQIEIEIKGKADPRIPEKLLASQGVLGFYAVIDRPSFSKLFGEKLQIADLFPASEKGQNSQSIICCCREEALKTDARLPRKELETVCRFAWDENGEAGNTCLYALDIRAEALIPLSSADIQTAGASMEKGEQKAMISFSFRKQACNAWSKATRNNLDHPLAMVLDGKVLAAPVVRSVIENGNCQVSGNFSLPEARYIAAILGNGELPCNFRIIR